MPTPLSSRVIDPARNQTRVLQAGGQNLRADVALAQPSAFVVDTGVRG